MKTDEQIKEYIAAQPEPKRSDLQTLHQLALQVSPGSRLWFSDGRNSEGKVVTNPGIGYGFHTMKYADGTTRDCFQIGIGANATGISIHILGIKDKAYLSRTFGATLGKAGITGYCIRFKKLQDIDLEVLEAVLRYGFAVQQEQVADE